MGTSKTYKHTLICDYLRELGVPYTENYTNKRFSEMPFKSMYGMKKLLEEYNVPSEGYLLNDKEELSKIVPPYIARVAGQYVIITNITSDTITYLSQGKIFTAPLENFKQAWDGTIFQSYPDESSKEPEYAKHATIDFFQKIKKWVLIGCAVILFLYLFISNGLYQYVSTYFIAAIDLAGLYFTFLLVQKSLNIKNKAADKVCAVLQAGGCDDILETKASKFFGLFGWSEVGFSYFSVSLITMLLLPKMLPWLALCNVLCLPFTIWSISYQRFVAHKWCTLCVCVQISLWLLFFSYLFGGWLKEAWPLSLNFIALGVAYVGVMLAINALMPLIENKDD